MLTDDMCSVKVDRYKPKAVVECCNRVCVYVCLCVSQVLCFDSPLVRNFFIRTRQKAQENNKCLSLVFYCRILCLASDSWSHVTYLLFTIIRFGISKLQPSECVFSLKSACSLGPVLPSNCCCLVHLSNVVVTNVVWLWRLRNGILQKSCTAATHDRGRDRAKDREREKVAWKRENPINIPYTQLPIKLRRKDACASCNKCEKDHFTVRWIRIAYVWILFTGFHTSRTIIRIAFLLTWENITNIVINEVTSQSVLPMSMNKHCRSAAICRWNAYVSSIAPV